MLPAIGHKTTKRPGDVPQNHYIPNNDNVFWDEFYAQISETLQLSQPLANIAELVNPYTGRFGYRWHPVAAKPCYFHIGIDIHNDIGTPIYAIDDGLFQYSGYAPLNGNYVVISHPHIKTEDGWVLNSIYMHCDTFIHKFNLVQKVWRKYITTIPLWVNIPIRKSDLIATVGGTGVDGGYVPHLHLQLDFISPDGSKRVSVDPVKMFGFNLSPNLTAEIRSLDEFRDFYRSHEGDMSIWSKFIESYL